MPLPLPDHDNGRGSERACLSPLPLPEAPFLRATLDGLSAHVAVLDAEGVILLVNKAWRDFARQNGADAEAALGEGANYLRVCECATGDCADEASDAGQGIEAVLHGKQDEFTLEYPCHSPIESRWFILRVRRFPTDETAGIARVVVSHENITARRLAEDALARRAEELARTTEALARSNAELDSFAYIASHDLKAPLRGISNLSRWIEEDLGERITEEAQQHFELMRGRVNRLEAMIEGILEYSRIGRVALTPEPVNVAVMLAEIVDLLALPSEFAVELVPPLPILVTEELRLRQVFQNLIQNAVKHHDRANGHIGVSCRDIGEQVEFTVSDDGPGIAPRFHDRVFGIFQTLQARDKREGTGIGLAMVRKIVEGYGGTITLDSEAGKGAHFRFSWPKSLPAGLGDNS